MLAGGAGHLDVTIPYHGLREPRRERAQGLASLPGVQELRHAGLASLGAAGGGDPPLLRPSAGTEGQLFRHRGHLLAQGL